MEIDDLLKKLVKPAQRAIENAGIVSIEQLSTYTEKEVISLHGIGKNAFRIIKETLHENGLDFSDNP